MIRSLSIDEETLNRLHEVANRRRLSVNSLLTEIIDYYLEIGMHASDIGLVHMASPYFKLFIDNVNKEELIKAAREIGKKSVETWIQLRNLKKDLNGFYEHVLYHDRTGWAKIRLSVDSKETKIIFMHDFGETWSEFLEAWFTAAYETMVGKTLPNGAFTKVSTGVVLILKE
jgi:hypothetical protein